ncbi:MAG: tyrosine-type recombinase/integrase [Leptospirillia bacterium]
MRQSTQTTDRRAAQEYHDRVKAEFWRQDQLKEKPKHTWDEAALRWLDGLQNPRTQKNAAIRLSWLQTFLRGKLLEDIDRSLIAEITAERGKGVTPTTVNRYLETLQAVLHKAFEWGWRENVPAIPKLKTTSRRIRWLTHEEAKILLTHLPEHQAELARFALATGLRQRNILELEWSQVDLKRALCWIHPDQAKGGRAIGVPLNQEAISVLLRQKGKHDRWVFTFRGRPVGQVNTKAWRSALKRAGIKDFRWHDLRHTWASWHVQSETPLHILQELGGWADYKMVQRYAHLAPEHLAKFAENSTHGTNMAQSQPRIV